MTNPLHPLRGERIEATKQRETEKTSYSDNKKANEMCIQQRHTFQNLMPLVQRAFSGPWMQHKPSYMNVYGS